MFCDQCGKLNASGSTFCEFCGSRLQPPASNQAVDAGAYSPAGDPSKTVLDSPFGASAAGTGVAAFPASPRAGSGDGRSTDELVERSKTAGRDAAHAFRALVTDPVGGLARSFEDLGPQRAVGAAVVFALIYALCIIVGIHHAVGAVRHASYGFYDPNVSYPRLLLFALVPLVATVAVSAAVRKITNGTGTIEGEVFFASAAMVPFGFLIVLSTILGVGNLEVIALLSVFALCYTILMIYSGALNLAKVSSSAAALVVPISLVLTVWLFKILLAAALTSYLEQLR